MNKSLESSKPKKPPEIHEGEDLKSAVPVSKSVIHNDIVELSDEWLYNVPDFLDHSPRGVLKQNKHGSFIPFGVHHVYPPYYCEECLESQPDLRRIPPEEYNMQKPSGLALKSSFKKCSANDVPCGDVFDGERRGIVLDIPKKQARLLLSDYDDTIQSNLSMSARLLSRRKKDDAKKRLVWLPKANPFTAIICCLASPESERPYLAAFFESHNHREKYFLDETMAISNTWTTEFHLSSY